MKKVCGFVILLLALLCLPACKPEAVVASATPSASAPGSATPSAAAPAEASPSAPEHTLPWDAPEEEPAQTYEAYFSQVTAYQYPENMRTGAALDGFCLHQDGSHLYVAERGAQETLWEVTQQDDLAVVVADERWIYAILNETDLIRMNYWGEEQETLFVDKTGLIFRMNRPQDTVYEANGDGTTTPSAVQHTMYLADGAVLYFWAGAPDGDGLAAYRLYVPEQRADVLYQYDQETLDRDYRLPNVDGTFYRISAIFPRSSHAVTWSTGNPAFYAQYDADPERFDPEDEESVGRCELEYQLGSSVACYRDLSTDDYREQVCGVYIGSDLSGAWWET
jgi:hypothetical protein